jgi:uncharacterized protein (TIGR00255 family)
MIKSMTAYARVEKTIESLKVSVEIRSYNSRHLDLALRIPHGYLALEDKIKGLISKKVARGRLEVQVKIKDESKEATGFEIDKERADAYYEALCRLKENYALGSDITVEMMAGAGGVLKPVEIEKDLEAAWNAVSDCLEEAGTELDDMRKREGAFLAEDLRQRLESIARSVDLIESESGDLLDHYQERLRERVGALTKGIVEIDPSRIAQEAALMADRSDISEEIVRAKSHVEQFAAIMDSEEPAGRTLNFLLQEFNREFNTMGSKAGNTNVSHTIVTVKSELEKIREQVQNIE